MPDTMQTKCPECGEDADGVLLLAFGKADGESGPDGWNFGGSTDYYGDLPLLGADGLPTYSCRKGHEWSGPLGSVILGADTEAAASDVPILLRHVFGALLRFRGKPEAARAELLDEVDGVAFPALVPGEGDAAGDKNAARWLAMLERASSLILQVQDEIDGTLPESFDWGANDGTESSRKGWPKWAALSQDLDRVSSVNGAGGDSLDERIEDLRALAEEKG